MQILQPSLLAGLTITALSTAAVIALVITGRTMLRLAALAKPAQAEAWKHLKVLRMQKMDKEAVVILSLQKGGSTLLCYVCALINTRNSIDRFRNDFDLVPMLSFPQAMVFQNVNARQDGKYQLYKINGRVRDFHEHLTHSLDVKKIVWICREFEGYYRSVFWWVKNFYPRVTPLLRFPIRIMSFLRFVTWRTFKAQTLELLAQDHVEELWSAYHIVKNSPADQFIAISYEHLTRDREATLRRLATWFQIEADAAMLKSIAHKTSKDEMAKGDRFDPLRFGEGGGQTKVNLEGHKHTMSSAEKEVYERIFVKRFAAVGISSYAQYIDEIRRLQDAKRRPVAVAS
jgi:hypothetical protein